MGTTPRDPHSPQPTPATPAEQDVDIDEAGDESFPASDPPSWNSSGAVPKPPQKRKAEKTGDRGKNETESKK